MTFQNSLAKLVYDRFIKQPDPQIPLYERFENDQGSSLYRSFSTNKITTEAGMLERLAQLERKSVTEVHKYSDRFIVEAPTPEPNFIVDEKPDREQQQQQEPLHRADTDTEGGIGHSGRLRPGQGSVIRSWDIEPQKHTLKMELDR